VCGVVACSSALCGRICHLRCALAYDRGLDVLLDPASLFRVGRSVHHSPSSWSVVRGQYRARTRLAASCARNVLHRGKHAVVTEWKMPIASSNAVCWIGLDVWMWLVSNFQATLRLTLHTHTHTHTHIWHHACPKVRTRDPAVEWRRGGDGNAGRRRSRVPSRNSTGTSSLGVFDVYHHCEW
jgi:hypothetical protein